jgi:hypothetical protein
MRFHLLKIFSTEVFRTISGEEVSCGLYYCVVLCMYRGEGGITCFLVLVHSLDSVVLTTIICKHYIIFNINNNDKQY